MCDNEMSRDHDAPVEYLRILASLKLRFGLATLVTAHGALPVVYPMVALDTQLPNACVGYSPSQWLRGSSSFPMNVTGRQAEVHSGSASITRQSARCFVSLIAGPTHQSNTGGDTSTALQAMTFVARIHPPSRPRPFHWFDLVREAPIGDRWPSS